MNVVGLHLSAASRGADDVLGCVCRCVIKFCKQYSSKTVRWIFTIFVANTPYLYILPHTTLETINF